jgi:hypothetical protein
LKVDLDASLMSCAAAHSLTSLHRRARKHTSSRIRWEMQQYERGQCEASARQCQTACLDRKH